MKRRLLWHMFWAVATVLVAVGFQMFCRVL